MGRPVVLPVTHRDAGAYIMWSGSPYALLHIMGRPQGVTQKHIPTGTRLVYGER
jgi:hypothetical protein